MSFKEGFEAIGEIKSSGQRLGASVSKIEALEVKLTDALNALSEVESALNRASTVFDGAEKATAALQKTGVELAEQSKRLPEQAEVAVLRAEEQVSHQLDRINAVVDGLTKLVENAIEKKLEAKFDALASRFSLALRDELKDTRSTLRDAMEVNSASLEKNLEGTAKEIIAEMPRGLFGRPRKR